MYNTTVVTRRLLGTSGRPMQIAIDFPGSWTDATSQDDVTLFQLTVAQGEVADLPTFNALAASTFPGIDVAANANSCLMGFELVDEFYDITTSNLDSEIGSVDRAKFLDFINDKWPIKADEIATATTDAMKRSAFIAAVIAALSDPA